MIKENVSNIRKEGHDSSGEKDTISILPLDALLNVNYMDNTKGYYVNKSRIDFFRIPKPLCNYGCLPEYNEKIALGNNTNKNLEEAKNSVENKRSEKNESFFEILKTFIEKIKPEYIKGLHINKKLPSYFSSFIIEGKNKVEKKKDKIDVEKRND